FGPDEVFLQLSPLGFDASTFEIWGALLHGARLAILPGNVPALPAIAAALRRYGVTTLWLTSGLLHEMVEEQLESLGKLGQLLAGGEVLSVADVLGLRHALPNLRLLNCYGPTEATTFACTYEVPPNPEDRPLPIGRPIANTRVYVLDAHRQPVPVGVAGEI